MNTQPDPIPALISNIDQVLSLSNPRPPLVVLGDTVVQSRQALEQVRYYLVNLQNEAEQKTTAQPDGVNPNVDDSQEASIRRIVRQELNLFKTQLTQTLQAEIKLLRQERRVLIREIRQLQRQGQSQSSAEPVVPSVGAIPPSSSVLGSSAASTTAFLTPSQPLVSGGATEAFFPYAGAELPSESNRLQPNRVESSSIAPVGNLTPEPDFASSIERMPSSGETDVEESSEPAAVVETPPQEIETQASSSEEIEPSAPPPPVVEKNTSTLVETVLSVLDLRPSSSPPETLPTSAAPEVEQERAETTPPPMDGEDYTLASPHENLLPEDDEDEDQVDSHLLVERTTIQHLEEDLLTLESNLDSPQEMPRVKTEDKQQPSEEDSSVQQPPEGEVLSFEDLFTDVSFLDSSPVSPETSAQMTLDELIDHLNLTDHSSIDSEVDTESLSASLEAFNQKQET